MKTKLISQGDGDYVTEDGRGRIYHDSTFETECDVDHPHPMRVLASDWDSYADYYKSHFLGVQRKGHYVTYQCPGGEIHNYAMWTVEVDGDWTDNVYDTFAEARSALEDRLGPTVLVRQRKPKPERQGKPLPEQKPEPKRELNADEQFALDLLRDELAGIEHFLARADELEQGEWAPYVDRELVERNRRRKIEVELQLNDYGLSMDAFGLRERA